MKGQKIKEIFCGDDSKELNKKNKQLCGEEGETTGRPDMVKNISAQRVIRQSSLIDISVEWPNAEVFHTHSNE